VSIARPSCYREGFATPSLLLCKWCHNKFFMPSLLLRKSCHAKNLSLRKCCRIKLLLQQLPRQQAAQAPEAHIQD
jgi:hypothetical protein